MKDIKTYSNKNILVLGLGKSGFAVSELLLKLGAKLTLNDKADLDKNEKAQELKAKGVRVIGGHHPVDLLDVNKKERSPGRSGLTAQQSA